MNSSEMLQAIQVAYDKIEYPAGFTDRYVIMECLAERDGIDTFLVQKQDRTLSENPPMDAPISFFEDRETSNNDNDVSAAAGDAPASSFEDRETADNGNDVSAAAGDAPACFVAKCYDRTLWTIDAPTEILRGLEHDGLPKLIETFGDDRMTVTVREYVEGLPLDRYAAENDLTQEEIIRICLQICDILAYLHHRPEPIIHRDIKPQNIIVRPDGKLSLIDFDIARIYRSENDTDTRFFGTVAYAPPEQYGFSQTDARTDIYSLGILLRYLLTGSTRENKLVQVYRPLARIIDRCTAFAPKERFADVDQIKKALQQANPAAQRRRRILIVLCALIAAAVLAFAGYKIYEKVTYDPFNDEAIPAYESDQERIADAVAYMQDQYDTHLFDNADDQADYGLVRTFLIDCVGLDRDYVYKKNEGRPEELEDCFFPWGYDDGQLVDRDEMLYVAVKIHDPSIVADWSSLKDDTGEYPGTRVALAFDEKTGITTGVNRPDDLIVGEVALILANADRVFKAAEEEQTPATSP